VSADPAASPTAEFDGLGPVGRHTDAPAAGGPADQAALRAALTAEPNAFRFVQLQRLLERLAPTRTPVGGTGAPAREVARFAVPPSMAFPASEVQSLDLPDPGDDRPARVSANFLGLTGPLGVLPHVYTQLVADRLRARDTGLAEFLDLFHHRLLSLHYRAWAKYRPLERPEPAAPADEAPRPPTDRIAHHLLDLVGLGTDGLQGRLDVSDATAAFYAGLLAPVQRSALALEQLLEDHFDVPVEVVQFVGGWYRLAPATRCAVGEEREGATQLGRGALAGDEIWDQQSGVRIRLGPLTRAQYERFLPSGPAHRALASLVRFYTEDRFAIELQLVLAGPDVPPCVLGDEDGLPLHWGSWLTSSGPARDRDDTVLPLTPATTP
jgi:type VI secretion system protein ImpH